MVLRTLGGTVGRILSRVMLAAICGLLFGVLPSPAPAAQRQVLPGHMPAAVARLQPVGRLPGAQRLNLAIGLPLRNQAELDTLLQQLYDPASPNYRRYLTPEQFTERFGPTETDYQAVMDFAKSNGLTVTVTHPNRAGAGRGGHGHGHREEPSIVTLRVYQHPTEARDVLCAGRRAVGGLGRAHPAHQRPGQLLAPAPESSKSSRRAHRPTRPRTPAPGPSGTYRGSDFRRPMSRARR